MDYSNNYPRINKVSYLILKGHWPVSRRCPEPRRFSKTPLRWHVTIYLESALVYRDLIYLKSSIPTDLPNFGTVGERCFLSRKPRRNRIKTEQKWKIQTSKFYYKDSPKRFRWKGVDLNTLGGIHPFLLVLFLILFNSPAATNMVAVAVVSVTDSLSKLMVTLFKSWHSVN